MSLFSHSCLTAREPNLPEAASHKIKYSDLFLFLTDETDEILDQTDVMDKKLIHGPWTPKIVGSLAWLHEARLAPSLD